MAGLFGKLFSKKFPDTGKYEAEQIQLHEDYRRFNEIRESSLFHRFLELDREIHSGDFEKRVNELKNKKFKDTEEYKKQQRFKTLSNNKDIKTFLKFQSTGKARRIEEILTSETFQRFRELEKYVNSPEFFKEKASPDFKKSDAYQKFKEYKRLKRQSSVKWAVKTEKSSQYHIYKRLKDSDRLNEFYELQAFISSSEFKGFKAQMEDKNRFQKSEEASLINEFEELKKHKDIVWFLKKKDEKPFEELKKWKVTFEDNFDSATLDSNKWITGYYWGRALMNDTYSLEGDRQMFSDENIELRDSNLQIKVLHESTKGKEWSPSWGFREKEFDYTSGIISTGQSFRQQYGRFEAKVKFSSTFPVVNAFWMVGERITPHINIFKTIFPGSRMIEAGIVYDVTGKGITESTKKVNGTRFTNNYFIYSLDWTENELVWKINGVEIYRQTHDIPKEPMYLTFSSTLPEEPKEQQLPAEMEISWIKCYERV
ncbi:MAG: glycoside hydrolase family 16 protein [bacterium]